MEETLSLTKPKEENEANEANKLIEAFSKGKDEINFELYKEYLKDFKMPEHNKNCKKCGGLGRIGFNYDVKKKERKGIIPCPIFEKEIKKALKEHIDNKNKNKNIEDNKSSSFNDLIINNK